MKVTGIISVPFLLLVLGNVVDVHPDTNETEEQLSDHEKLEAMEDEHYRKFSQICDGGRKTVNEAYEECRRQGLRGMRIPIFQMPFDHKPEDGYGPTAPSCDCCPSNAGCDLDRCRVSINLETDCHECICPERRTVR